MASSIPPNPIRDVVIVGGSVSAASPAVGQIGSAGPLFGDQIGFIDGSGNLQPVSSSNPLPISGSISVGATDMLNKTGSQSSAAVLFTQADCTGYFSVDSHVVVSSGCTVVAEVSEDGTTWDGVSDLLSGLSAITASGHYIHYCSGKQFRLRISVYGSGTTTSNSWLRGGVYTDRSVNLSGTPTVNLGTISGVATQTTLAALLTALGSPFQAGGSIGNTTFASTQSGSWIVGLTGTVPLPTGAATQTTLASILTTLGSPFQAGASIANTTFASTQSGTWNIGTLTGITNDVNVYPGIDNSVSGVGSATGTASTQAIALVSSKRIFCTSIHLSNSSATAITVNIQDGSGGTVLATYEVPAGGGYAATAGGAPLFKTTSGNGLFFAASTGVTTLYCNAAGFSA